MGRKISVPLFLVLFFVLPGLLSITPKTYADPGGVSADLQTWLKADEEVYSDAGTTLTSDGDFVQEWHDQETTSGDDDVEAPTTDNRPIYRADSFNFNPTLEFDGTDDYLETLTGGGGYTAMFYTVISPNVDITSTTSPDQTLFTTDSANSPSAATTTFYTYGATTGGCQNEVFTFAVGFSGDWRVCQESTSVIYEKEEPYIYAVSNDDGGGTSEMYANGTRIDNDTNGSYIDAEEDEEYRVGGNDYFFGGRFANVSYSEIILYSDDSTVNERTRIKSYLAIKYGVTLSTDYLDSSSNTLWNSTTNSTYQNDIGGIGRDDTSPLDQPQSRSENNDSVVTMNKPLGFSSDQQFVLWGNDNGALTTTDSQAHPSYDRRSTRIWKVSLSNTPGVVEVSFDLSQIPDFSSREAADYAILIDSVDTDFSSGASTHTTGASITGDTLTFSNVSFSHNDFFALGGPEPPSPGGVSTGLELWYRADYDVFENTDGTNPSEDGDSVAFWGGQDILENHSIEDTAAEQPTFQDDTTNNINFNPIVNFDGTERLPIDSLFFNTTTDTLGSMTAYQVSRLSGAGERIALSYDDSSFFELLVTGAGLVNFDTFSGGTNSMAGVTDVDDGRPHIIGGQYDTAGVEKSVFVDGNLDNNGGAHAGGNLGNGGEIPRFGFIGTGSEATTFDGTTGPNNEFSGDVGEVILYSQALNTSDRNRVESYMALKYGITLDQSSPGQDYTASDGSTEMWDTSANQGVGGEDYIYDIAGIGLDNGSLLSQPQSKSVNTDAIIEMEKPGGFATDLAFVVWANDDGPTTTTSSGIPTGYIERIERVWRVDVTGSAGQVSVTFDLAATGMNNTGDASEYAMLIDNSNADFSTGADEHTTGASLNGDLLTFTNLDFTDGDFFTLARVAPPSPGGVYSGLAIWLKANEGVDAATVTDWADQSGSGYDCIQPNSGAEPSQLSSDINFNESISFNGTTDYCAIETLNYTTLGEISHVGVFSVFKTNFVSGAALQNWAFLDFDRSEYFNFYIEGDGRLQSSYFNGGIIDNPASTTGFNDDEPHLATFIYDSDVVNETVIRVDGTEDLADDQVGTGTDLGSGAFTRYGFVGEGSEADAEDGARNNLYYDGEIAEVIYYENDAFSGDEVDRIETYLAVKYGISKTGDYIDSDSNTIWNSTTNSSYHNDVTGIGRDDNSDLSQQQSKSENDDGVITINKGGSFGSDLSFVVWGNDSASGTAWTATGAPTDYERLAREWRVAVSGSPGSVTVDVDVADPDMDIPALTVNTNYYFLYDSDNDGSLTDESPTVMIDQGGDIWRVTGINFSDGMEFTIAESTINVFPGGVSDELELWFKADGDVFNGDGINLATDGQTVFEWDDASANDYDANESDLGQRPLFRDNTTDNINFNPVVDFDGTDDRMPIEDLVFNPTGKTLPEMSIHSVARIPNGTTGERILMSYDRNEYFRFAVNTEVTNDTFSDGQNDFDGATAFIDGIPHLMGAAYDQTAQEKYIYLDGSVDNTVSAHSGNDLGTGNGNQDRYGYIGTGSEATNFDSNTGPNNEMIGEMGEIILYSDMLTADELIRVESYLAVKYGITKAGDYRSSDSNPIWDSVTQQASYLNDIAGIGVDTASGLTQLQSLSVNADAILTVSNPTDIMDLEFFLWGNDNDDDGTIELVQTELPSGVTDRLDREWRIEETGDVGDIDLAFDLSAVTGIPGGTTASDFILIIDDFDSDFSVGANATLTADSFTSNIVTFSGVDGGLLKDGCHFTVGIGMPVDDTRRRIIVVEAQ